MRLFLVPRAVGGGKRAPRRLGRELKLLDLRRFADGAAPARFSLLSVNGPSVSRVPLSLLRTAVADPSA